MTTIEVKNASGEKVEDLELNANVFGIEPNVPVMHLAVRALRNSWRSGTSNTRTRGQVRGGGKKPWRQKGTGHARQGTIRAPHWTGGGVVFGPHPRSYDIKINKKEVNLAMRSALSAKLADGQLHVIDTFGIGDEPKTKTAKAALAGIGLGGVKSTVVIADEDANTYLSLRNLERVAVVPVSYSNVYDYLNNKALVFTTDAIKRIEEVLA